jgi:hypothetical protein
MTQEKEGDKCQQRKDVFEKKDNNRISSASVDKK